MLTSCTLCAHENKLLLMMSTTATTTHTTYDFERDVCRAVSKGVGAKGKFAPVRHGSVKPRGASSSVTPLLVANDFSRMRELKMYFIILCAFDFETTNNTTRLRITFVCFFTFFVFTNDYSPVWFLTLSRRTRRITDNMDESIFRSFDNYKNKCLRKKTTCNSESGDSIGSLNGKTICPFDINRYTSKDRERFTVNSKCKLG